MVKRLKLGSRGERHSDTNTYSNSLSKIKVHLEYRKGVQPWDLVILKTQSQQRRKTVYMEGGIRKHR